MGGWVILRTEHGDFEISCVWALIQAKTCLNKYRL